MRQISDKNVFSMNLVRNFVAYVLCCLQQSAEDDNKKSKLIPELDKLHTAYL